MRLKAIEKQMNRPMSKILRELYRKYGNQRDVAKALGVSPSAVSTWLPRLGLQEHTILKPRKRA
jgi:DNA-binding MarR family transcriptional regulator